MASRMSKAVDRGCGCALFVVLSFLALVVWTGLDRGPGLGSSATKLDAEEAGYYDEFSDAYEEGTGYARDLAQAVSDAAAYEEATEENGRTRYRSAVRKQVANLNELRALSGEWVEQLQSTTPPSSIHEVHERFVNLLIRSSNTSDPREIADDAATLYHASLDFQRAVETREDVPNLPSPLNIVYSPPGPVTVDIPLVGNSGFAIGVDTPVGEFSVASSQVGVSKLVLIESGKTRYFKMDRDFEVILYSPGNVRIRSNMKENTLTIDVGSNHM